MADQGEAAAIASQPWEQRPFLRAGGTGACSQNFCHVSQTHPWLEGADFPLGDGSLCFSPPTDPDSQLYDMGYTPEEEAPACPDEFDDFVTFEASMSSGYSHKCWLHVEWDLGMEERGICCDWAQECLTCKDKFSLWLMGPPREAAPSIWCC